jgi:hypothetical protein
VIKVGVTGRRDLAGFNKPELKKKIRDELESLKPGNKKPVMLSSIAAGADQLCAKIGLELGYELICPLPFPEYRSDFSGEDLELYDILLKKASSSFVVSSSPDRDAAYLAAGKYIVENCDVLLAIWDGKSHKSICGTDAVIDYAEGMGKNVHIISI